MARWPSTASPRPAESPQALAQFGYVAQDHPVYRRFRVSDLLRMGRALNEGWDQVLAEHRLADLNIPLDRPAGRLSGGQQAQLALTLALAKRPRLLILDEPVASLDPLARREFMKTLMATVAEATRSRSCCPPTTWRSSSGSATTWS